MRSNTTNTQKLEEALRQEISFLSAGNHHVCTHLNIDLQTTVACTNTEYLCHDPANGLLCFGDVTCILINTYQSLMKDVVRCRSSYSNTE